MVTILTPQKMPVCRNHRVPSKVLAVVNWVSIVDPFMMHKDDNIVVHMAVSLGTEVLPATT